jgi:hypothetical protein
MRCLLLYCRREDLLQRILPIFIPGGSLGKRLSLEIKEIMITGDRFL